MQNKSLFELNCLHTNSSLKRQIIPTNESCRCESDDSEQGFGVVEIMDFNPDVTSIDENPYDLQLSQASSAPLSQYTFIDNITKKPNRMGPAAGPTLILKSWLGLREVEDWELKLDAEEELQVEEVDILFREHSTRT